MATELVLGRWVDLGSTTVSVTTGSGSATLSLAVAAYLTKQDVASNKSYVNYGLFYSWNIPTAISKSDFALEGPGTGKVWLGYWDDDNNPRGRCFGYQYQNFSYWPQAGNFVELKNQVVNHNSDGNASITLRGVWELPFNGYPFSSDDENKYSFTGDGTLPRILRGATITSISPETLVTQGDSSLTVTISDTVERPHKIKFIVGNYSTEDTIPQGSTTYTWTPSRDVFAQIGTGNNLVAKVIVYSDIDKTTTVQTEARFGFAQSTNATFKITKTGNDIKFTLNGVGETFKGDPDAHILATKIAVMMWQNSSDNLPPYLEIDRITFAKDSWRQLIENDTVKVDTSKAAIYKNGSLEHGLGALGNDYETFVLKPGYNAIQCLYSEWAEDEPDFKLKYREVYL